MYLDSDFEFIEDRAPSSTVDGAPDILCRWRTELRSISDRFENEAAPLTEFVCSQIGEDIIKSSAYLRIRTDRNSMLKEARQLEAAIRGCLQIQAGQLLLWSRESRSSSQGSRSMKAEEVKANGHFRLKFDAYMV